MDNSKIIDTVGLTFDDVLLLPGHTKIKREAIDISTNLTSTIKMTLPFISSPMDTVTTAEMAISLGKLGALGVIHRNLSILRQAEEVKKTKREVSLVSAAVGVGSDFKERLETLVSAGANIIIIDSAHGFAKPIVEATKYIARTYPRIILVSGNVVTSDGARALIEAGAKALRVGMGPGSICTTRIVTGMGVPQITAIMEVAKAAREKDIPIIADGGIRYSGDIVKAIAAGASAVMLGSIFAGCREAPGETISLKGKKYKSYRGMGSTGAMKEGSSARYGQEYRIGQEKKLIAEGVAGFVPYKGEVRQTVDQLAGGLRSGMYYTGVANIRELQEKTKFIRVTEASLVESHPHDILLK